MTPGDVARSYLGAFVSGDPDRVAAWVTDDFVNEHTAAGLLAEVGRVLDSRTRER